MKLEQQQCQPCHAGSPPVDDTEAARLVKQLPGWDIRHYENETHLTKTFTFSRYADGLNFTINVGEMADKADHHPSIITTWGKVSVHWWTHSIGGLHLNDFIMAARTDGIYKAFEDR